MLLLSGSCCFYLAHVASIWLMLLLSGSCCFYLAHAASIWPMLLLYGSCYFYLAHVASIMAHITYIWLMLLLSGSCCFYLAHVASVENLSCDLIISCFNLTRNAFFLIILREVHKYLLSPLAQQRGQINNINNVES